MMVTHSKQAGPTTLLRTCLTMQTDALVGYALAVLLVSCISWPHMKSQGTPAILTPGSGFPTDLSLSWGRLQRG